MQFSLHATRRTLHGASRLVQAIPAWLVKTRRAPSRHSRDARVYGHTTTAMHTLSTHPAPAIPSNTLCYPPPPRLILPPLLPAFPRTALLTVQPRWRRRGLRASKPRYRCSSAKHPPTSRPICAEGRQGSSPSRSASSSSRCWKARRRERGKHGRYVEEKGRSSVYWSDRWSVPNWMIWILQRRSVWSIDHDSG